MVHHRRERQVHTMNNDESKSPTNGHSSGVTTSSKSQGLRFVRRDLRNHKPAANLIFNERMVALQESGQEVYHFGFGQSPFPIPDVAVKALQRHAHQNSYLPIQGNAALRREICRFHERHDAFTGVDADDVILATGSKQLIVLLMQVFEGEILLAAPSWTTYKEQSLLVGKKPHLVPCTAEDDWTVTPDALAKTANECGDHNEVKLLVLCNPDNPTGTSYSAQQLQALTEVCRQHHIVVLSDEIYARLRFDGNHVSIRKFYPEGTIVSSGFSKWMSAGGWRVGYHVFPAELRALLMSVKSAASQTYSCAPAPMQFALCEALQHDEVIDNYIRNCRRILGTVAEYVHRELGSVGVSCVMSTAGYYCMLVFDFLKPALSKYDIHTGKQFCDRVLRDTKVALMPSEAFLRPHTEFSTRFCFINFDGAPALAAVSAMSADEPLDDEFLGRCCPNTVKGVQLLKEWVSSHSTQ